jgi:hypothetical protein
MSKNKHSKEEKLSENNTGNNTAQKEIPMSNKINLLELGADEAVESSLEVVRLGSNETAIIPFTAECEEITVHYCPEPEINGYVVCNGPDCILCRIGRKRDQRLLLPVYLPADGCVGILPVSRSLRPFALLPQIATILKAGKPMVMFVTREGTTKHTISTVDLKSDVDAGEAVIKSFVEEHKAGRHDFSAVYPRIDNEQLKNVEAIGRLLALKGMR